MCIRDRLYRSQWIERWGLDTARRLDAEIHEGFDYWKSLVAQIDCDAQPGGHLYTCLLYTSDSVLRRDYPTLLGILLFASLLVVVMNQLTDLAYRLIDPRIKTS